MKYFQIEIEVDTNDADYITNVSKISEDHLNKLRPLLKEIKERKDGYNFQIGEYADEDSAKYYGGTPEKDEAVEIFLDFAPYGEHGFHTVESVEVTPWVEKEKLI